MSIREFWDEEPELLWAYRKSYIEEMKFQRELSNYNAWLNGLYVYDAVSKSIYNSFKKENKPIVNYVSEPYNFSKTKEEYEREERIRIEKQIKEKNERIKDILKRKK